MCDCKVIVNECVAKQHRMVVCKMALMVKKTGGEDGLLDEWHKTAEILRKTAETVLGMAFGKQKGDRETRWWNEEV